MGVRSKGRILALCSARKNRPPTTSHPLAVRSSIRGQGKQYTRLVRPRAPRNHPPGWYYLQVVNSQFRGVFCRKCMAHDVGISGMECILVLQRHISTPPSQIPCDATKFELFTTFACLTTPVSIGVVRARFNEPAWDASSAFRQDIRSWLYWVIVTSQDVSDAGTTPWARLITILMVVRQVRPV